MESKREWHARLVRYLMLDYAMRAPQIFCDYCLKIHYMKEQDEQEKIKNYLEKLERDADVQKLFKYIDSVIAICEGWFEEAFDAFFKTEDIVYIYAKEFGEYFNSRSAEYMFILRNIIDDFEGIKLKREETEEERAMIFYLVYEGDEKSYMQKHKVSEDKFQKMRSKVLENYSVSNINELLICFYIANRIEY